MSKPIALITGATSGIGAATARLIAKDYNLILCGRRSDRLEKLQSELATESQLLSFDVRDKDAVFTSINSLPEKWQQIDVLINNAGNAHGMDLIQDGNTDDWDAMTKGMRMDLNPNGIKVTSIDPGLVETEFSEVRFKGDQEKAEQVYKNYTPLTPYDVAETISFVLSRPAHVMIGDLLILPTDQASSTIVNKKS